MLVPRRFKAKYKWIPKIMCSNIFISCEPCTIYHTPDTTYHMPYNIYYMTICYARYTVYHVLNIMNLIPLVVLAGPCHATIGGALWSYV